MVEAGWKNIGEYYPIKSGDEITAQHFGIIRQIMWAIDEMSWQEEYELPPDWNSNTEYRLNSLVAHPDQFGTKRPWKLRYSYSKGEPPPGYGWVLCARDNVYCDYSKNSGCWDYHFDMKASRRFPPDFNKYTQHGRFDENHYFWPKEKWKVWVMKKYSDKKFYYFRHKDCPLRNIRELPPEDEARRDYDVDNAKEAVLHKSQESPIEFALENPFFLQELISGPIGTQYVEYHPPFAGFGWPPPWYYPYYVWPGSPRDEHLYYDKKWQGYQSGVERFVDFMGSFFKWPLAEGQHECNLGLASLWDTRIGGHINHWKCNWSGFEKCLSLYAGEGEKQAKSKTKKYDWYLDYEFPPDPMMYKLLGPTYVEHLLIKAVWRRTWRHSFKPVRNGLYWPGDWGPPPYWDEDYFWWCSWENVFKAYNVAAQRMRQGDPADILALAERHYPSIITKKVQEGLESEDNTGDYDYWDEIYRLQQAWDSFNDGVDAILEGGGGGDTVNYQTAYEMNRQMLNDMKGVLDCLKYVYASVGKQVWSEKKASYEPPLPLSKEWFPWCGWDWTGEWIWVEDESWLGEYAGYTQLGTAYWGGKRTWSPADYNYMYTSWGYGGISRKIKFRFYGSDITNWLKSAKFNKVYICFRIQGTSPGIGVGCDWEDECDPVSLGSVNGISTCADPIYRWISGDAELISDDDFYVFFSGSAQGTWAAPPINASCGGETRSLWRAAIAYTAYPAILLILDYKEKPLGCTPVVRSR